MEGWVRLFAAYPPGLEEDGEGWWGWRRAAMCPLASVYMSVAESGTRCFWINNGQGVVISVCNKMMLPKEGIYTHLLAQWRCVCLLSSSLMFPGESDSFGMCSPIRNVASEMKVLRGGQSCDNGWVSPISSLTLSMSVGPYLHWLVFFDQCSVGQKTFGAYICQLNETQHFLSWS